MSKSSNIMNELAAYGAARSVAKTQAEASNQEGTKVFGFKDTGPNYEITTGDAFELEEYNVGFNIIAEDTQGFNLIVRKDSPNTLHKLPKDKLRSVLTHLLDSI